MSKLPNGIPPGNALLQMAIDNNLSEVFFLDAWPIQGPIMITLGNRTADQFVMEKSMPKSPLNVEFIECVGGQHNLVVDDGPRWKTWRAAFNPGFSNSHLMTLVPDIVESVSVFRGILDKFANQDKLFRLEKHVTRLTIDIIGRVVMDYNFNSQIKEHYVVSAFESSCRWMKLGLQYRPSELWDIRRPYIFWRNTRIMNKFIDAELNKRWQTRNERSKSKYVVDLALETYLKDKGQSVKDQGELDPDFRRDAVDQVKICLFAGHETSASTISYCFYYMSRNAEVGEKVLQELDVVFGGGADIGQRIKDEPTLVNKLEYMMAVIKEVLRMHAPANTVRRGAKGFFVTDPKTGEKYDTDGMDLLALASGTHMNPAWGDPFTFRPERFLNGEAVEGAWVPFSKAPRSCIGQELATIEIRIVLAMTFSQFAFKPCYNELEKLKGDGSGYPSNTSAMQEMWGTEAYQMGIMARPREGMPLRVSKREERK
ncbi:Cytochrome P450 52A13 [Elsinoe australis]|uniref:Cytochrome P450 52A13 n=1 Tax=Elsinoe australis TaxID=40998 RepID=A0A2P7Z275_9PEZI|nr:Cytochrome P450 52A13 [Elsinoe australis]